MWDQISAWADYWWNNLVRGWGFGNNLVGIFQALLGVVVAFIWIRKRFQEDVTWEAAALKWLSVIFVGSVVIATVFVVPFQKHMESASTTKNDSPTIKLDITGVEDKRVTELTNRIYSLSNQLGAAQVELHEMKSREQEAHDSVWLKPITTASAYVALRMRGIRWDRRTITVGLLIGENSQSIRVVFLQENGILRQISDQEVELQTHAELNTVSGNVSANTLTNLPYMQIFFPRTNIVEITGGIVRMRLNSEVSLEYELSAQKPKISENGKGCVLVLPNIPKRISY